MSVRLAIAIFTAIHIASAQDTCSIDGTAVNQITREPIPRARVTLAWEKGNRYATADNSGQWSLANAGCGTAWLNATRFGYIGTQQSSEGPREISLSPGVPAHVAIELIPESVITGKVVDEAGDPMFGAVVTAHVSRITGGKRAFANASVARSDDRGVFRIPSLPPGRYIFCAEPPPRTAYAEVCYPGPADFGASPAISISPGQERGLDFAFRKTPLLRVSGVVKGIPAGARATVGLRRGVLYTSAAAPVSASPDGKFTIPQVAPGSYMLTATVQGSNRPPFAHAHLDVGDSNVDGVVLAIEPRVNIHGAVRIDSDESAPPAPALQILLRNPEGYQLIAPIEWSAGGKSFDVSDLTPGNYGIEVSSPNYYAEEITLDGREIVHNEIALEASGSLDIVLSRNGGSLEGDVILDDGSLAPNASVILLRNGEFGRVIKVTDGHFNTRNLEPGDYTAYSWDDMRNVEYANPEWMRQYAAAAVTVTIAAGQMASVKLTRITAPPGY